MLRKVLIIDAAGLVHSGVQERVYIHHERKHVPSWYRVTCGALHVAHIRTFDPACIVTCLWCTYLAPLWGPPWVA